MFKYTTTVQKKLEDIFRETGWLIRYEKGTFRPGYCILEEKKVIVVNKYYGLEAKISSLLEILSSIDIDAKLLSDDSRAFFEKIKQLKIAF